MNKEDLTIVQEKVETALAGWADNRYGFQVAPDGIHQVDGRWWVVLQAQNNPPHQSDIWDAIALVEELLEDPKLKISVTAA